MQALERIKVSLILLPGLFVALDSEAAASRNICSTDFSLPTIAVTIPNSIDCGGTTNFVGEVKTNWFIPGSRACKYRLFHSYDTYFSGAYGSNHTEYAYLKREGDLYADTWHNDAGSIAPCEAVDYPPVSFYDFPPSTTRGGSLYTLGYVTLRGTNHSGLGVSLFTMYADEVFDDAGDIVFYDDQGRLATSVPLQSTAYAQVTIPAVFPAGVRRWQINGSSEEQTLGCSIDPTSGVITVGTNSGTITVRAYVTDDSYWIEQDLKVGCSDCDDCEGDGPGPTLGSVQVIINAGKTAFGKSAGYFKIDQAYPSAALSTPSTLKFYTGGLTANDVSVVRSNGIVQQVIAPQISASVVSNSAYQYQILFYTNSSLTGMPVTVWTCLNPDGAASTNRSTVLKVAAGLTNQYDYVWDGAANGWELTSGIKKEKRYSSSSGAIRTEVHLIRDLSSNIKFQETNSYQTFPWGERLIGRTVGSGASALVTSWSFYTNTLDTNNYGRLYQVVDPGGNWERYAYTNGKLARKVTQYLDNPIPTTTPQENSNRVTSYSYYSDSDGAPIQEITDSLAGSQIAWVKYISRTNETIQIQKQTCDPTYGSSHWLTNRTWKSVTPPFVGQPSKVLMPDGTMSFYSYALSEDGNFTTNTVTTGEPDSGQNWIVDGTRTATVLNKSGNRISHQSFDVASELMTSSEITLTTDSRGRPTQVQYLDGTTETTVYGCCGIESFTDREGITTSYNYDPCTKQVTDVTRAGITTHYDYDAAGNLIQTTRIGTNSSAIVQNVSAFDTAGRLLSSTPASNGSGANQTISYSDTFDGNNHRVKTTFFPNGGTRIEAYYQDGSLMSVTGTAVHPLQYVYGLSTNALKYGEVITEKRLGSSGETNEWTATYRDSLGRIFLTVYSAASGTPSLTSRFNDCGQQTNTLDPDGIITLFQFNGKGQVEYTVVDMNTNSGIDFTGLDRITRTVSDVTTNYGTTVLRTRTYVWATSNVNSSNLISSAEESADGLRQWRILWNNGVGVTNRTATFYAGSGNRYVTNTLPDGSYTVAYFQNSLPISVTSRDAAGNQIGQTSYGYDAHNRQKTVTDARTGTSTYYFNDADQISGGATPVPGPGQSPQVTTNYFDVMGQIWKTTLADNTSTTNEYFTNGLLKKSYGSRTYAVEYTYDAQGRVTTMKTWKNASSNTGTATTTFNYDVFRGWLTNKTYEGGSNGPTYTYTSAGRLLTRLWARATNTTYSYNKAGELAGIAYNDGTTPGVIYDYDRRGRQTGITNGSSVCKLTYNNAGGLLSEAYLGGSLAGLTVSNVYDTLLRRTTNGLWNGSVWLTQARFVYDPASRLKTVGDGSNSATYAYLANSPLVDQILFTNNAVQRMVTTKQYDLLNRLTNITSIAGGSNVAGFAYQNNDANQRTRRTEADSSYWVYTYDSLGQVSSGKKYWGDNTPVAGQQFEYTFDDIGNRKTAGFGGDANGANLEQASYSANALNQYTSRDAPGVLYMTGTAATNATVSLWASDGTYATTSRKGEYYWGTMVPDYFGSSSWRWLVNYGPIWVTVTNLAVLTNGTNPDIVSSTAGNVYLPKSPEQFAYDADGNLAKDGRWTNNWDAENRLIVMTSFTNAPSGSKRRLTFGYDYQGRRITKMVETWTNSTWTVIVSNKFVYDGWNLIAELNGTNNALVRSYIWGLDLSGTEQGAGGVGGLVAVNEAGQGVNFPCFDANGNVAALIKANDGAVSANYEYGPFGEVIRMTSPMAKANPFRLSTKYQDDETELVYYGYRYYNASTGRWPNRDPIGEAGGDNLFGFAYNNPINNVDRSGLDVIELPKPQPLPIDPGRTVPLPPGRPMPFPVPGPGPRPTPGPRPVLGPLPTPGPIGGPYNYNTRPLWQNQEVARMQSSTGTEAQNACRRLASSKPGQNQYFYLPTSIGRATGAAAVLWGRRAGQAAAVIPPGYNAALAYRAGSVHRGHLIPNRYGGSGGLENIVTQDATFNLSTIKTSFEHKIDAALRGPYVCKFVCVLNIPAYRGQRATGLMDPGKPVPIGFAVAIITGRSYFADKIIQPVIIGDLANDIDPWNRWATGNMPLN